MMHRTMRKPSPAMVVACLALAMSLTDREEPMAALGLRVCARVT
jgi:hypothetical protein